MLPHPYHIFFRFGIPLKYMSNLNIFFTLLESLLGFFDCYPGLYKRGFPSPVSQKKSATATYKKMWEG